jgi:hypothetical protein
MAKRFFPAIAMIAVAAGLIAVVYSGASRQEAPSEAGSAASSPRIEMAPVVLPRADGGSFSSESLHGKSPLVLNFFATW